MEIIRIPAERIGVLVGKEGATRKMLEEKLKVKLEIDKDDCAISLHGESVDEYFGKDVVKAIGRGFEPNVALKLLKEDYCLRILSLNDFATTRNSIVRLKGRIIGEDGKTKKIIEDVGEADLSIYGNTIGVIASLETIDMVMEAIYKLLDGAMHSTVYAFLEKSRRRLKESRIGEKYGKGI